MKILITGIAGLLGSNFAKWLLDNTDHQVYGLDDLSCGDLRNIPPGCEWNQLTIGEGGVDEAFACIKPDVVYHFAAYAAECLSPFIRRYNYQNNLVATAEIVTACINHDVQRLVYTASMAVYGRGNPPFDEADKPNPIDPYGIAKAASERDIQVAGDQHGLDYCIIRPHNVYGPGQVCTQVYRNVFGIWMDRFCRGLPLRIYGDGSQRRAFSYIGDCVKPLYLAGIADSASKQIINLGGEKPISILGAATALTEVMGGGVLEHHEPRREVKDAWCTVAKSQERLGYVEHTSLHDGLANMWQWYREHEHPVHTPMELETKRGIYSYWKE
jgi:UDP-glucose 4-epimerase